MEKVRNNLKHWRYNSVLQNWRIYIRIEWTKFVGVVQIYLIQMYTK